MLCSVFGSIKGAVLHYLKYDVVDDKDEEITKVVQNEDFKVESVSLKFIRAKELQLEPKETSNGTHVPGSDCGPFL